jgi:peptidoglycan hydrolase CwlO-like protein
MCRDRGERVMGDTEKLSQMMIRCGLATGHGDTIDDLIFELEKQIKNTSAAFSDARKQIERLRKILSTVLEACEDVNSPDRKVRKEITRTVRKALKEKE